MNINKMLGSKKININDSDYIVKEDYIEDYDNYNELYYCNKSDNKNIYLGTCYKDKNDIFNLIYNKDYIVFFKYLINHNCQMRVLSILDIKNKELIHGNEYDLFKYYKDQIKGKHLKMRNCLIM